MIYVDKTDFVTQVLATRAAVVLLPRPRRFGKTVNLSTVRYFVEKSEEDRSALFEGLAVWGSAEARQHFQRYPVIALTFKDVKAPRVDASLAAIQREVRQAYRDHAYLLKTGTLEPDEAREFESVLRMDAPPDLYARSLRDLSAYLSRHHGQRAIILIDEYDTPIHAAATGPDETAILDFFRAFLSSGLKDNPHLYKGVLTGILRIARENLFSGLNNLAVYSLIRTECSTSFGFTQDEVKHLAEIMGASDKMADIESWYNGYRFGGRVIYNPWSVLNYLDSEDKVFRPYWVNTSSDDLLRRVIFAHGLGERGELETLLGGGEIEKRIDDRVALRDLGSSAEAVWSFLLFTGYLKATRVWQDDVDTVASLAIPNKEVHYVYRKIFRAWLEQRLGGAGQVTDLLQAVLAGDAASCERMLGQLLQSLSVHDLGTRSARRTDEDIDRELHTDIALTRVTPEQVYQVFVVGLLLGLQPKFDVRSNRESGTGRYDVMILPRSPGQPGVVLELKVRNQRKRETVKGAMATALAQLRERDYAAELRARGAEPVHQMAIVFDLKQAWVEVARAPVAGRRAVPKKASGAKATPKKRTAKRRAAPEKASRAKPAAPKKAPRAKPTAGKRPVKQATSKEPASRSRRRRGAGS